MKSKIARLEGLRGAAALYVMAGHLILAAFPANRVLGISLRFGQTAVIAFFLISGFVIYHSTHGHQDQSFRGYFQRRALRIYPIFVLALVISYLVSALAGHPVLRWGEMFGNLFMLQDFATGKPGVWVGTFCGDLPLWSLSYEWWFYLMFFPLYKCVPAGRQLPVAAGISLAGLLTYAVHPNQVSLFLLYFILWWTGLEIARTYGQGIRPTFRTQRVSILILAGFCLVVPLVTVGWMPRDQPFSPGIHPLLEVLHFASGLVLLCGGLLWARFRWVGFGWTVGLFAWAAPVSYAVYVLHYPVGMYFIHADWIPGPVPRLLAAVLVTFLLATLAEGPMQRAINRWVKHAPGRASTTPAGSTRLPRSVAR